MSKASGLTEIPEEALWRVAEQRLELAYLSNATSASDTDDLPERLPNESLASWLTRACIPSTQSGEVTPLIRQIKLKKRTFVPLAEIRRLAADGGDQKLPLPDPNVALESSDGRFRLRIKATADDQLHITIQALGFAAMEFAHRCLGLLSADDPEQLVAEIRLNEDGDGEETLPDDETLRRALLNPRIVLVKDSEE